jgi:lipoprotein NlpD
MTGSIDKVRGRTARLAASMLVAAGVLAIAGCASNRARAPVEDRMAATPPVAAASASAANPAASMAGAENAGKPGYYTVKPGDTLARIAFEHGQDWRDVAKWNKLDNPNVIEVGQVLRVLRPGAETAVATRPVTSARVESKPLSSAPAAAASAAPITAAASGAPAASASAAASAPVARDADDDVNWIWPASGAVVVPFDDVRSKGIVIAGKAGDPVLAAADGRVVYAGSGLRGYGNLLIVKHNNTYLTAYAHNQTLLVKEDQAVRRGQKIAEMGSTDAESVQLHFEIRRLGKPVDPAKLLPPR